MSKQKSRKIISKKGRKMRSTCKRTMGGDTVDYKKLYDALDGMRQFINGELNKEDHKDALDDLKRNIQEFTNSSKVSCKYNRLFGGTHYTPCKRNKAMQYYALGFALLTQKKLYDNDDELADLIMRNFSKAEKHAKAGFYATSDEKLRLNRNSIEDFLKVLMNKGIVHVQEGWKSKDNSNTEIYDKLANKLADKKVVYYQYKYGQHEGEQNEENEINKIKNEINKIKELFIDIPASSGGRKSRRKRSRKHRR